MTTITNHHKSPIAVGGVFIPAGGSGDVENWDAIKDSSVHKTWLDKKVISVGARAAKAASAPLEAKHRGGGSYSIMRGDEEVTEGMTKADAEAFNAMSDADKAAYVAKKD